MAYDSVSFNLYPMEGFDKNIECEAMQALNIYRVEAPFLTGCCESTGLGKAHRVSCLGPMGGLTRME